MPTLSKDHTGYRIMPFQVAYNAVTNTVDLSCDDASMPGGLKVSLPHDSPEGKKALRSLQALGLAPHDTEADKSIPSEFRIADIAEETYQYTGKRTNLGPRLSVTPIGVKKGNKLVCIEMASELLPNTMVVTKEEENRARLIRNIVRYNVRFSHAYKTVIYSTEVGKHQRHIGLDVLNNEFELLLFLRGVASRTTRASDPTQMIIIEDFTSIVEGLKASTDATSDRTSKAVRAEILSLIQDISRKRGKDECGWHTHFVFCLESVNDKDYNAFLPTVNARIAMGDIEQSSYKLFSKNVNAYSAWGRGRGYIQQDGYSGLFQS